MKRRVAREKALQTLFQMQVGKISAEEALENVMEDATTEDKQDPFLLELVRETAQHLEAIDDIIKRYLRHFSIDRLANVDRAILRLGICELLYIKEIPEKVTLNEMIELAKAFGDEDSRRFTNGVLSNVLRGKLEEEKGNEE
ncbi:transcription antitermination factor NusB [Pullulanibacillus sp. KACC 23026]|uniref:transcription antitermination factor NusB n=1 Tax=Pullulanibacillus sp. KACC 23026 TaxID=3028315 RepID=UPI0023AF01F8|nr:transcription antitermination factor NusB [Pullulanibacillus sp. KACC 23026]WEG14317.1 transcription antitermination factor NusB [Pullulanibacillus sp. KACC 23026]